MNVDLRTCKHDDWLRFRNGDLGRFIKRNEGYSYPAVVEDIATARHHRILDDGRFWEHEPDEPNEYDVVEILGAERPQNEPPDSWDRARAAEVAQHPRLAQVVESTVREITEGVCRDMGIPARLMNIERKT